MLLFAQSFIRLPVIAQTPFRVSIPSSAFSIKWQDGKGTVEVINGGRKFRGNGGAIPILQANLQMHPSSSADHKMQRLIIHFHSDQYGSKLLSVKLLNGTKIEFNIDNDVQGDFTKSETKYNSWVWRDPISVSPQSVLRLEVRFPSGFEGPGSLTDFILTTAEVDYPLKPLSESTTVTNATSSIQLSDKSGENRKPVTQEDKDEYAALGASIAKTDSMVARFRDLEAAGPRQKGFDMGIGITGKDKLWGPGKQWFLNSLSTDQ
jgi:hypothetical protein